MRESSCRTCDTLYSGRGKRSVVSGKGVQRQRCGFRQARKCGPQEGGTCKRGGESCWSQSASLHERRKSSLSHFAKAEVEGMGHCSKGGLYVLARDAGGAWSEAPNLIGVLDWKVKADFSLSQRWRQARETKTYPTALPAGECEDRSEQDHYFKSSTRHAAARQCPHVLKKWPPRVLHNRAMELIAHTTRSCLQWDLGSCDE